MQQDAQAMKQAVKETNIENIDELMEDIHEATDMQEEINSALAEPMQDFDDDDLLDELAELEEMEADQQLADLPAVNISTQPQTEETSTEIKQPAKKKTQEQTETEEL